MPIGDLLRYAFLTLLSLVLLAFGMKLWGKHKLEKQITHELESLTSTSSSFEQFYEADAKKSLFLTIYQLHLGEQKLGISPKELLDKVFDARKQDGIFDRTDSSPSRRIDPAKALIRNGLLRNYENSKRLGLFKDSLGLEILARGEAPQIQSGPASGKVVAVGFIISPEISPGIEKVIPNFIIRPPGPDNPQATEFEIAQAKLLANSLHDSELLESKARDRIIKAYDIIGNPPEPVENTDNPDS